MKSLVELLEDLLLDCGRRSGAPVHRDVQTLRERVEHEGDSFITITLPTFCSDFERCLDEGRVAPGLFLSFRKERSGIPSFLKGFLCRVFDKDGVLLREPSVDCIRLVRQACLFGKKVRRQCSQERCRSAAEAYTKCDDEVVFPPGPFARTYGLVATQLMRSLKLDDAGFPIHVRPRHGPGATGERLLGNQKWRFPRWHDRLERVGFSFWVYGRGSFPTTAARVLEGELPCFVDPENEQPVRVTLVPKTLKTPRVIAVEPVCMQYAQQGLFRYLVRLTERSPLTRGHVNFRDQSVNQVLAKTASSDGKLATLDMAEASDRVSLAHVTTLLASTPRFREWVLACRSTRAKLPDGHVVHLKKFASMGSALCFPMEALVFFTSIITSRIMRRGISPTARNVRSLARDVYVYGDDLIVPTDEAPAICDDLEAFGLKVNRRKSFWTGKFRESCGSDCYDSELVTPVYLRRDLPTSRKDASGLLSALSTANQLEVAGYPRTATALREVVERHLGQLPQVPPGSPALGWCRDSHTIPRRRYNKDLQREESLCWVPVTPVDADPLEGDAALAKCLRMIGARPVESDPRHLEVSPRRYGLTLKRRWVPLILS